MPSIQFKKHRLRLNQSFKTEEGETLPFLDLAYHTAGTLNADGSNVVWICHALTANSNPADWWAEMFEQTDVFDPENQFIICVNVPGSCYGSSGPLDADAQGETWYHRFPKLTIRDVVASFRELKKALNINKINLLIGASMGGQQAVEWSIIAPNEIEKLILLATNAKHSAWGVAFNESQRWAIETDPSWEENQPAAGINGMKAARSIALLSYRSYEGYVQSQSDSFDFDTKRKSVSYQRYQGEKLAQRFNAFSYYRLSQTMDSHDVGRNRGGVEKALSQITAQTLVIALENDVLFPEEEQLLLSRYIPDAHFAKVASDFGHDGFLIETPVLKKIFNKFFQITPEQIAV